MKIILFSRVLVTMLVMVAGARAGENLMVNGDLSADKPGFSSSSSKEFLECRMVEGKLSPADKRCLEVEMKQATPEKQSYTVGYQGRLPVDPTRKYRLRVKALVPEPYIITCGGYAYAEGSGKPIPKPDGKGVWQYHLIEINKTPIIAWQDFETTIGPQGSDCKTIWDPQATSISMNFWIIGGTGKIYFADFAFEEF